MPTRKPHIIFGAILVLAALALGLFVFLLKPAASEADISATVTPTPTAMPPQPAANLLDLARVGTWDVPSRAVPSVYSQGYKVKGKSDSPMVGGYQESDFLYVDGKYYLFATGSQEPAWIDVYVGDSPEDLLSGPPAFTHVAPIRYPTVVKDGDTWNIWGVNPTNTRSQKWTEHWVSTNADPTDFKYADTPFSESGVSAMVDFAVRKNPNNGKWYGVGFETWSGSPLLLAVASSASGPWTKLNYTPSRKDVGVFGETGAPPWASASRPDPNLAFTEDGLAWIFFTGKSTLTDPEQAIWRAGMVQVDTESGEAIGNAVVLYDPEEEVDLPFVGASDLNLVSVPGQADQIFAYANSADYPLAVLDVPDEATLPVELTSADLVRLDLEQGYDPATNLTPDIVRKPFDWGVDGLVVDANNGGATGYLASGYLEDLTFEVDFTPKMINSGDFNVVASVNGSKANAVPGITVLIDDTGDKSYITAIITGTDKSVTRLNSGISALPETRYDVELMRLDDGITLTVNGAVMAQATKGSIISGLEGWSLAAKQTISLPPVYPFTGTIHSFTVTSTASDKSDSEGQ